MESGKNVDGLVPETTRKKPERVCPGELPYTHYFLNHYTKLLVGLLKTLLPKHSR